MKILCVIPSRIASTRLARKPLLCIQNKPMVQWVYEKAKQCPDLIDVVVATDSEEISQLIISIGGKTILTDPHIKTGSDRVACVAQQYPDVDVVINLQGDEPFIKPEMLTSLIAPYKAGEKPEMSTLACPLIFPHEYDTPDIVKVITDKNGHALYFSRSPIPFLRDPHTIDLNTLPVYHHQGVYAYRRDFIDIYTNLAQTPLEKSESLEQLRALENGYKIKVCITEHRTLEINTPAEYERAQHYHPKEDK